MTKTLGLLFTFAFALCLVGCSSNETTNTMENESQTAIEAYEASIAADEAAMDEDFGDSE